jgi:hypothetical protein
VAGEADQVRVLSAIRTFTQGSATTRKSARPRIAEVTLAYLKGKDAEPEEAQEHANSSSLALYAYKRTSSREILG